MAEDKVSADGRGQGPSSAEGEEIRVTDRRRIHYEDETGDITESEDTQSGPSLKPTYVEELEARTRAAEQKVLDVRSRFEQLRSQMERETDETRQRLNRAADERARREKGEFIASLLPVLDNLYRAIDAAEHGRSFEAVLDGVRTTASSFENALLAAGLEPIVSIGEAFDPELHEAVDTTEVEPDRDGTVTAEYSRGFKIGERLLRPARVQVGYARGGAKRAAE